MASQEDSKKYREDFLFHGVYEDIDSAVISRLQECGYYKKWQKESNKIVKKHPFLRDFFLHGSDAVSLTVEEHEAFVRYMELRDEMETAQKQECYYVGQIHANILQKDLEKRMDGVAGYLGSCGKDIWNREEVQEMLGDLLSIIREEREKNLKKYPEYQKLRRKENKLLKSQPFIQRLIEEKDTDGKLELSRSQQESLIEFFALQQKKGIFEMIETLLIGCRTGIGCAKALLS
jgi:hypothetical protein